MYWSGFKMSESSVTERQSVWTSWTRSFWARGLCNRAPGVHAPRAGPWLSPAFILLHCSQEVFARVSPYQSQSTRVSCPGRSQHQVLNVQPAVCQQGKAEQFGRRSPEVATRGLLLLLAPVVWGVLSPWDKPPPLWAPDFWSVKWG